MHHDSPGRARRLEKLKSLLVERDTVTAAELADELSVSARTVQRDLDLLRDQGVPVEGERGRGGGLRLERGWSLGRVHLSESEAIGMLLGLAIAEKVGSPILLGDVRSIARKIATSFAPAQAARIRAVRSRILVGGTTSAQLPSPCPPPPASVTKPLLEAFAGRRVARIVYEDRRARVTEREIEIHYLFYSVPVWYVLAWDRLRNDVRAFRIDRIRGLQLRPDQFRLRTDVEFLDAGEHAAAAL